MSQHASELCVLLVDDIYGQLSSRVFATLLRYGRLNLPTLVQHTRLSSRQLKHGLAVLIQQHLVLHYTALEEGITYYEADWMNAYSLVRAGKIIKLAEDKFGEAAGGIISNLLLLGHTRVGDLSSAYAAAAGKAKSAINGEVSEDATENKANGVTKEHDSNRDRYPLMTRGQLHSLLQDLMNVGYIEEVREEHFRPHADNFNEAERLVKRTQFGGEIRGTKQKAEFDKAVSKKLKQWRDGDGSSAPKGVKRSLNDSAGDGRGKRAKLSSCRYGFVDQEEDEAEGSVLLNDDLVLRINYDKCTVALRSMRLVELARDAIGETTSKVYAELLHRLEAKIPRCREFLPGFEEDSGPAQTITTLEVSATLDKTLDLASAIGSAPEGRFGTPSGKKGDEAAEDANDEEGAEDDDHWGNGNGEDHWDDDSGIKMGDEDQDAKGEDRRYRMSEVQQHIKLLAEDPRKFVRYVSNRGLGEWAVDFDNLAKTLIQTELENTIAARFGRVAARLVRVLLDKGKLDEKQVAQIGMLRQKEIRSTLTAMQEAGHIELQEIPRDNNRQPSRTMFLWYFEPERCRQLVLQETYKAMARCLQRAREEKKEVQLVIDKAERSDVIGKEDRYLMKAEIQALQRWKDKEEKLLGQVGRLDALVGVLRDY
ncbi:hypothetical protein L228DRAFT_249475 [Xylona heveae TC161]|uniref:DNA-directed RNA polymerase III subunit RPC3 n=1 Tax=Xylona heveae (strain CBS 132557 / TC161) TaxID=1328760 RepID=A0A165F872_XYLHT|nr:hypothetical protein L228DRAFT_249475 [Xylona heveae TC161]KZF20689.1 hypothetical protein L228DRAFT_249475 [Xylona heveae TC161]